jgi:hypothetical protein
MRAVDELLEDEELLDAVYDAQGLRHSQSRTRWLWFAKTLEDQC